MSLEVGLESVDALIRGLQELVGTRTYERDFGSLRVPEQDREEYLSRVKRDLQVYQIILRDAHYFYDHLNWKKDVEPFEPFLLDPAGSEQ